MQQFYGQATELESAIREGSASLDRENYIEKMDQLADAITFFSSHPTYQNQLESMVSCSIISEISFLIGIS